MWKYNDVSELYHYGVKGMKWGKRLKIWSKRIINDRSSDNKAKDAPAVRRVQAGSKYDGFLVAAKEKNGRVTGEYTWESAFANPHVAYGTHGDGTRYRQWKKNDEAARSKVSSEYQQESAYNSRKNQHIDDSELGVYKPITGSSGASQVDYDKREKEVNDALRKQDSSIGKVSSEYQQESAYNSQKNVYPGNKKNQAKNKETDAQKQHDENKAKNTRKRIEKAKNKTISQKNAEKGKRALAKAKAKKKLSETGAKKTTK